MKRDHEDLFTELTPPPGGAERFAQRLEQAAAAPVTSPRRVAMFAAAASVVAALVTAVIVVRQPNEVSPAPASAPAVEIYDAPELDRLLGRSARPMELVVTVNAEIATVTEVATTNEKIRIYRVN